MSDTERVTMVWPKALKEQVRDKVGPRGLTEYTLEAVEMHLKGSDGLRASELELNQAKHLVQDLADRLVMSDSKMDRMEALMEVQFPSWVDTSGWPSEFANRVPVDEAPEIPEGYRTITSSQGADAAALDAALVSPSIDDGSPMEAVDREPETAEEMFERLDKMVDPEPLRMADCLGELGEVCIVQGCPVHHPVPATGLVVERPAHEVRITEGEPVVTATEDVEEEWVPPNLDKKDDLFARISAATGVDPTTLDMKVASELPKPEAVVLKDLCTVCGDELVDGECWTCM